MHEGGIGSCFSPQSVPKRALVHDMGDDRTRRAVVKERRAGRGAGSRREACMKKLRGAQGQVHEAGDKKSDGEEGNRSEEGPYWIRRCESAQRAVAADTSGERGSDGAGKQAPGDQGGGGKKRDAEHGKQSDCHFCRGGKGSGRLRRARREDFDPRGRRAPRHELPRRSGHSEPSDVCKGSPHAGLRELKACFKTDQRELGGQSSVLHQRTIPCVSGRRSGENVAIYSRRCLLRSLSLASRVWLQRPDGASLATRPRQSVQ